MLPGGIQGLVHDLQNGTSTFQPRPIDTAAMADDDDDAQPAAPAGYEPEQPQVVAEPLTEPEVARTAPAVQAPGEDLTAARPASVQPAPTSEPRPAEPRRAEPAPSADDQADAGTGRGRRPKENTMKEYHIVKDNSQDSWQLFIDMAQQYKSGGGKLATIYIDESLKSVLDRMKYAGPEKLSTSAILSSIVARFIYDHEDDIRKVLFSGDLI